MRIFRLNLLVLVLFFLVTSCQKEEIISSDEANFSIDLNLASETDWEMANQILVLINAHRATLGLSAILSDHQYASAYAVDHTQYMINMGRINHDNFGVRAQALKDKGAETVAENVAFGYKTAESVVNAWLNSDGHRKIIEGNYTHSGFGVIKTANDTFYFTQLFYRK